MTALDAARDYADLLGWCTIPMKDKLPAIKWKPFQRRKPVEAELVQWHGNGHAYGVGVIFGDVSGGLASRDFDSIESYQAWASTYATMASTLATVATRRGRHVYCRLAAADVQSLRAKLGKPNGRGAIDIGDGELRVGIGCYSVLPPSKLASGFEYRWLVSPSAESLPLLKLPETGFGFCYTEDTEYTGGLKTLNRGLGESSRPGVGAAPVAPNWLRSSTLSVQEKVDLCIDLTLPNKYGKRHRAIFQFGRHLKSIPELAGASLDQLKPYVRQWHQRALPYITTKPFEETWFDFVEGLDKAQHLVGEEPIAMAFAKAAAGELPECAQRYEQQELRLLVALCRELQRFAGHEPFYLAGRSVSRLLGVKHWTVARWLRGLCRDRILIEVKKGTYAKQQASSYRYLQPL